MAISDFETGVIDEATRQDLRLEDLETQEFHRTGIGGGITLIEEKSPSAVATVTFSSIPADFRHLRLYWIAHVAETVGNVSIFVEFNGDTTGANYTQTTHTLVKDVTSPFTGDVHTVAAASAATGIELGSFPGEGGANEMAYGYMDCSYYTESKWKAVLATNGAFMAIGRDNQRLQETSGRWKGTAAINAIRYFSAGSKNFDAGTKLALYGIG